MTKQRVLTAKDMDNMLDLVSKQVTIKDAVRQLKLKASVQTVFKYLKLDKRYKPNPRGFASMDKEKQRRIASKGGKAAHELGYAHEFTSEEARAAGRLGGRPRS